MRNGIWTKGLVFGIIVLMVGAGVVQNFKKTVRADPNDGLVGYWDFNEGNGSIIHDSSGNGNDGEIVGDTQWVNGVEGTGLLLNGDDIVVIQNNWVLNPSQITVSCWVKFNRLAYGNGLEWNQSQFMICKGGDRTSGVYHLSQGGTDPSSLYIAFSIGEYWNDNYVLSLFPLETDHWYFITGTYDGDTLKIYLDGDILASKDVGNINVGNNKPLYFSYNDVGGYPYYLDGILDEERIYNKALSEEEISLLYYTWNPTTTESVMNETTSTTYALFETIVNQNATAIVSVTGDLNWTMNFTNFKLVLVNSGSFEGKGFYQGNWSATIESVLREGYSQGFAFKMPGERKIYLKGEAGGDMTGVVDGYLNESVNGSGVYDHYQACWQINRIGSDFVFARMVVNGTLYYQDSSNYSSELYVLQSLLEGVASGAYNRSLSITITYMRINTETNPYYGEGFSIISYTTEFGSGEGWAYNHLVSENVSQLNGVFAEPLAGIVSGILNESGVSRTLTISIERLDIGLPPRVDLKVRVWGPQRVSPGQTVDYIIEYRNDGLKIAYDSIVFNILDSLVKYLSSSTGGLYDDFYHMTAWNLGKILPKTTGYLNVQVEVDWGLPGGTELDNDAYIINTEGANDGQTNLALNGIRCNKDINKAMWKKWGEFSKLTNSDRVPNLFESGSLWQDLLDVQGATPVKILGYGENGEPIVGWDYEHNLPIYYGADPEEIRIMTIDGEEYCFTGNDNNGLKWFEENQIVTKDTVFAYSGGTRTVITAILNGNLECNRLVLISPMAGLGDLGHWKWEIEQIQEMRLQQGLPKLEIVIYQSQEDILPTWWLKWLSWLFQVKFSEDDPWLAENNVMVNPPNLNMNGRTIKIDDEINKQNHSGLFHYINNKLKNEKGTSSTANSIISIAFDPNIKYGPNCIVLPGQKLNYTIEFENEGEGSAFGVYFTDTLDEDLNDSSLEIGPVISTTNDSVLAPPGYYNPDTRTITWFVGEVGPGDGGYANISVDVSSDVLETEIINYATVYFPSVPEETRTNGIVSIVDIIPPQYSHVGQNKSIVTNGDTVGVFAHWTDGGQFSYAWAETNESGAWVNKSPVRMWNAGWTNFTLQPNRTGCIGWRIHTNDTAGNENITPVFSFTVIARNAPLILNENPANNSINMLRPPAELNATVEHPDDLPMTVYIKWKNHGEQWVTLQTYTDVGNGLYNFVPSTTGSEWIWGNTIYIWSVNVTDGLSWTNETYHYTTNGSRYDVNNNNMVNFQDAGLVWTHRTSLVPYDGLYDVNGNGQVNFQDAGLTWTHRN